MFFAQKMALLDLFILQKDVDAVAQFIINSNELQAENQSPILQEHVWLNVPDYDKKKIFTDLKKNYDDLVYFFSPYFPEQEIVDERKLLEIPVLGDALRQYSLQKKKFEDRMALIRKQKEEIAVRIAGLQMHLELNNSADQMNANYHSMLGVISNSNLLLLQQEFEKFDGEILTEGHVNDSEIVFISVKNEQLDDLKKLLTQLYFIDYGIPAEFFGEGHSNMMKLGWDYTLLHDQEELLEQEIQKTATLFYGVHDNFNYSLLFYLKISDVKHLMKQSGNFVQISGWLPLKGVKKFERHLKELTNDCYELVVNKTEDFQLQMGAPTRLKNWRIFRVFEQLVTIFGIPHYRELDPTPIFGLLYVVMYGAMFGDVGQGLVLFLIGLIGKLSRKLPAMDMIFELLLWVGSSATFFGFLYGSYFGYESVNHDFLPKEWWASPIHNIDLMLGVAVGFGVVIISLSFILGIINCIRMRDWASLIFSHKGLPALAVYWLVLYMGYVMVILQQSVALPFWIIFGVLTVFLTLERVWEVLLYKHGSLSDWWMGFFEIFEFFLSMFTNTLSFIRIGAFSLTHAALMMAVFTLRDLAEGDLPKLMIIIIGNIFVVGMEGFVVGIQTLRLEYYEFFTRFFRGTGRVFTPISLNHK